MLRTTNDAVYTYNDRDAYFTRVPTEMLQAGLIFFDPDIGLQWGSQSYMKQQGIDKYLFEDSVRAIADRSSDNSVIVVYQHLLWNKARFWPDVEERTRRLQTLITASFSMFLSDKAHFSWRPVTLACGTASARSWSRTPKSTASSTALTWPPEKTVGESCVSLWKRLSASSCWRKPLQSTCSW